MNAETVTEITHEYDDEGRCIKTTTTVWRAPRENPKLNQYGTGWNTNYMYYNKNQGGGTYNL
jgi:hypothetical protein